MLDIRNGKGGGVAGQKHPVGLRKRAVVQERRDVQRVKAEFLGDTRKNGTEIKSVVADVYGDDDRGLLRCWM